MLACFGFGKKVKKPLHPFATFIVKVEPTGAWESTMAKVLKKSKLEMSNFKMHDDGLLQISGALDPKILLKVLGKSDRTARLVGLQAGGCSQNLHMPGFEQRQRFKQDLKDGVEMQAYYRNFYQKYYDDYVQGSYGHNYGNGYGRNYGNPQYLEA